MSDNKVQLADVCDVTDGTHYTPPNSGGPFPFLTVKDMTEDGLSFSGCSWISEEEFTKAKRAGTCPESGSVLFSKDGTVGKVHLVVNERPFAALSSIAILRPDQKRLHSKFLGFALQNADILHDAENRKTGSALRRIVLEDLKKVRIPLPPLSEQQQIAGILEQADQLRRTRRYAIELSDTFLPATFLELFGDRFDQGPFHRFGDLVKITGGGTPSRDRPEYFQGNTPWLTSKDMRGDYIWDTEEHITEDAIEKSATHLVPANSILIVVKSKVLMHRLPVAIARVPMCHGQDIKSIQCSNFLHHEFARFVLKYHEPRLLNIARGANTEGLTLPMLEDLPVPKVQFREQQNFASIVERHERLRAAQREALRQAEHLFQSLLHRAFTTGL